LLILLPRNRSLHVFVMAPPWLLCAGAVARSGGPSSHMRAESAAKKSVRNQRFTAGQLIYLIDFAHQSAFV
jgi:hypothetical protein